MKRLTFDRRVEGASRHHDHLGSQFFYKIGGYAVLFVLVRRLTKDAVGELFFAASLASAAILFGEL